MGHYPPGNLCVSFESHKHTWDPQIQDHLQTPHESREGLGYVSGGVSEGQRPFDHRKCLAPHGTGMSWVQVHPRFTDRLNTYTQPLRFRLEV